MKEYQVTYIENLKEIARLADLSGETFEDVEQFLKERGRKQERIQGLIRENTELLRVNLMPVLDDIISAGEDEVETLAEFARCLAPGVKQLDLLLNYDIHNALIVYARKWKRRDMLIRELYLCGMALFYMQSFMSRAGKPVYYWRMRMMFGEAASYLKYYDEIQDPETRGYIHRSMGNLTLADSWETIEGGQRKLKAIRHSLQVLTDPVYQKKTPSLPWDLYIYKSHQERMTAVDFMRQGHDSPSLVREIMESAEFVRERQQEDSARQGTEPLVRWKVQYEAILYHCGIRTLPELLLELEKYYMARNEADYSEDGIWQNIYLPGLYAEYISYQEDFLQKKKEVVGYMYRRMVRYVRIAPNNQLNTRLLHTLITILGSFREYPEGISQKDFLMNLLACRNPDIYAYLYSMGEISAILMEEAVERMPEAFLGVLSCETTEQVKERRSRLVQFAGESGMLQDIGLILFADMVSLSGRSWMEEERKMYAYHVYAGQLILSRCESTRSYAQTALGHHRFYDESGGYPGDYCRRDNPNQAVTDLVSIACYLMEALDGLSFDAKPVLTLDEALAQARKEAGRRFHPGFTGLLPGVAERLRDYFQDGKRKAYEKAFELLKVE